MGTVRSRSHEDSSLDGLDRQDDIATFPYVEFTGRDSVTCPTCQGTGRIPSGQVNELVALIPYNDQRLQPQRTKLYVGLSVIVCLLVSSLVAFFLFPRPVLVEDGGVQSVIVLFDHERSRVLINMTSSLIFHNGNFFTMLVDSVSGQVLYMKTIIGTQQLDGVLSIQPLSQRQMNFTVSMEIGGSLSYVYAFCTMASIKVHNIVVFMQGRAVGISPPLGRSSRVLVQLGGDTPRAHAARRDHSAGAMSQAVVGGARRSSGASETDAEPSLQESAGGTEWDISTSSLCSHEKGSVKSSTLASSESHQPDAGGVCVQLSVVCCVQVSVVCCVLSLPEDCATLLLACLYCRFSDIVLMLPGTCQRALGRCFPYYQYYAASCEHNSAMDGSSCSVELDCGLLDSCHEGSELLELAMEISEICYR
ncbi:hypothetical protein P4O66_022182 [Electrophorus voltai]|uniref:Transmembrane protein 106C n=1 Tax=Electrophorus voltai TaxID=2609070 RepID=A0AAD9E266_9TELE|nr:hypothetical protein P4O66_022182 [Electrophorus voltai]